MHVSGVPRERNMSILLQHRQHHKSCQKPFSISQLSHLISDVLGKLKVFIEEENQSNWRVYVQEGKSNFRSRRKKKRRKPPAPVANRNTQDQKRKKSGKTNKLPSETNLFGAPNVILAERDEQEEIRCRPPIFQCLLLLLLLYPFPGAMSSIQTLTSPGSSITPSIHPRPAGIPAPEIPRSSIAMPSPSPLSTCFCRYSSSQIRWKYRRRVLKPRK